MTAFHEQYVEADGFRVRYLEAGSGSPLVHIHSAGGLFSTRAHELLAACYRVIALEVPGYAADARNERSRSMAELGATIVQLAHALGLERFNLWGTLFGGALAFWTAASEPDRQPMAPALDPALRDQRRALLARLEAFTSLVSDFLQRHEAFMVTQRSALLHP